MASTIRAAAAALVLVATATLAQQLTPEERTKEANAKEAEAKAAEAAAKARKAELDTDAAGRVTSGITGSTEMKEGAGISESALLSATALNSAAVTIADQVGASRRVLIFPGKDAPDLAAAELFEIRRQEVVQAFEEAEDAVRAAFPGSQNPFQTFGFDGGIASISGALSSINAVASFFKTDYAVGGRTVTQDDYMLAVAVAGKLDCSARIVGQLLDPGAVALLAKDLDDLAETASTGRRKRELISGLATQLPPTDANLPKLREIIVKYDRALALNAAFIKDIGLDKASSSPAAPGGGTPAGGAAGGAAGGGATPSPAPSAPAAATVKISLETVLPQIAVQRALREAKYALFLRVHSSAGSFYTAKNVWSTLGLNLPFYASGSSVVSYSLVSHDTGVIEAGGLIPAPTDFYGMKKVAAVARNQPSRTRTQCSAAS